MPNGIGMDDFFMNQRVLITGGTGLIGREIVGVLRVLGAKVSVVSLDAIRPYEDVQYIYGDLTDLDFCLKVTKNMDYVFHLAGIKGSIEVTKLRPASFFVPLLMLTLMFLKLHIEMV